MNMNGINNIKNMKNIKVFIAIVTLCSILFSSTSCSVFSGGSNIDDVFSQLVVNDSETDAPAFTEHIYVIIPNGCSGELSLKARELTDAIEQRTGIFTSLKYDNELTVIPQNSCEILLGGTNRLVSDNALDVLRDGEYLCRWDDGALVICGRSDTSTIAAIEKFISDILPIASKYSLMPNEAHFEFMTEYDVKQIILNGYDLYDYVLTYSDLGNDAHIAEKKNAAIVIRDIINRKSGYFLDIIPQSLITSKEQKFIILSDSDDENSIAPTENGILLSGIDLYGLWSVVKQFINDISDNENQGIINLKYDVKKELDFVDTSFESVFCFLKENQNDPFMPNYELITLLKSGKIGVCFVGNPNEKLMEDFSLNIENPIEYREIFVGERKIIVAYDSRKVKSIDTSVDDGNKYLGVDIKTSFGEKISYIYIIENVTRKELANIEHNTVIFYDNCDVLDIEGIYCATQGELSLAHSKNKYYLANDLNLIAQDSKIINNSENLFYCLLKTKISCPNEMLDYTLK